MRGMVYRFFEIYILFMVNGFLRECGVYDVSEEIC